MIQESLTNPRLKTALRGPSIEWSWWLSWLLAHTRCNHLGKLMECSLWIDHSWVLREDNFKGGWALTGFNFLPFTDLLKSWVLNFDYVLSKWKRHIIVLKMGLSRPCREAQGRMLHCHCWFGVRQINPLYFSESVIVVIIVLAGLDVCWNGTV